MWLAGCAVLCCAGRLVMDHSGWLQGEQLAAGGLALDGSSVVLASSGGLLAHFPLDTVRQAGRAAGCIKVRGRCCGGHADAGRRGGGAGFRLLQRVAALHSILLAGFRHPLQHCSLLCAVQ